MNCVHYRLINFTDYLPRDKKKIGKFVRIFAKKHSMQYIKDKVGQVTHVALIPTHF